MSAAVAVCPLFSTMPALPFCKPGLGSIINSSASDQIIPGVEIETAALWPDDRGHFLEILRFGTGRGDAVSTETMQVSCALSYPGTIKAFHHHSRQTDFWVPAVGMFQVALVDIRPSSPSFGAKNTLYIGNLRPWKLVIPPGVAHGYKVIGSTAGVLVYVTNRFYDPADEG
ncbi:MAG: dTDP-4-dehydrorhamnose 3,5-epimerase family protein, partial [Bryobacteraceae bacterium]|nr:dTDP-4-dehydrorhamnose 3,5-epimerase family protein [Bryobacteraceae bacterium]